MCPEKTSGVFNKSNISLGLAIIKEYPMGSFTGSFSKKIRYDMQLNMFLRFIRSSNLLIYSDCIHSNVSRERLQSGILYRHRPCNSHM
jgi:hypothetical protein